MKSCKSCNNAHLHLLGWAIKNNKFIHISEVVKGKDCECVCVACKEPLIARKGKKRAHHFAHFKDSDCKNAPETALHLLAKEIIAASRLIKIPQDNSIPVPALNTRIQIEKDKRIVTNGVVKIDKVFVEREGIRNGFIPDIVIQSGNKFLIVEVCVTNPINEEKYIKIRQNNEHTIEINLSEDDALKSYKELEYKLLEDIACKKWIYHPMQKEIDGLVKSYYENHQILQRRIAKRELLSRLVRNNTYRPSRRNKRL